MKASYLYSILFAVTVVSCGQDKAHEPRIPPDVVIPGNSNHAPKACYILCDFSASQDDISRLVIIRNAEIIFRQVYKQEFRFKYYDISSATYELPFFECVPPPVPILPRPSDLKEIKRKFIEQSDTLHERLIRLSRQPSANSTCIIRTLDKVANSIAREYTKDSNSIIKIVILSDMLEDCTYSFGRIDIDHADYITAFRTLSRMPAPNFTFSNYRNIEITIVASSQRKINTDALYNFWTAVFRKYRYEFNSPIAVDLPKWVTD